MSPPNPSIDALKPGLLEAAKGLGLVLSDAQCQALLAYLALLQRWNAVYNLTSVRDPQRMLVQHVVDCLAVWTPLQRVLAEQAQRRNSLLADSPDAGAGPGEPAGSGTGASLVVPGAAPTAGTKGNATVLDVGSGGGLPGVVLAIMDSRLQVSCIDAVAKKAGFIRQVALELGLANLQGIHARVQDWPAPVAFDLITSRAFSSLADFTQLTRALLAADGVWMAMKGQHPGEELAALPPAVQVFHVEPLQVPQLDAQRCLVWMRPA